MALLMVAIFSRLALSTSRPLNPHFACGELDAEM
jgi:hypothetical protein